LISTLPGPVPPSLARRASEGSFVRCLTASLRTSFRLSGLQTKPSSPRNFFHGFLKTVEKSKPVLPPEEFREAIQLWVWVLFSRPLDSTILVHPHNPIDKLPASRLAFSASLIQKVLYFSSIIRSPFSRYVILREILAPPFFPFLNDYVLPSPCTTGSTQRSPQ